MSCHIDYKVQAFNHKPHTPPPLLKHYVYFLIFLIYIYLKILLC
jgi:hypothetical protein